MSEFSERSHVESRSVPPHVEGALSYFSSKVRRLLEQGGGQDIKIEAEGDCIHAVIGDYEMRVYEPSERIFSIHVRQWEKGEEGVPVTFTSLTKKPAGNAYKILEAWGLR